METSNPLRNALRKYSYFHTNQMSNDPDYYLRAYAHTGLSTISARDRFDQMTKQSFDFKHDGHTYMLRIGFDPGTNDDASRAHVRCIGVLVDPNKDGRMTNGFSYATTPLNMEAFYNDGRTLRYLVRIHEYALPGYLDNCIRIVAGFANYIRDNSFDMRDGIDVDFLTGPRGLRGLANGELFVSFLKDPTAPANYVGAMSWSTAHTAAVATVRIRNRIRASSVDPHELEGSFMTEEHLGISYEKPVALLAKEGMIASWKWAIDESRRNQGLFRRTLRMTMIPPGDGGKTGSRVYFQVIVAIDATVFVKQKLYNMLKKEFFGDFFYREAEDPGGWSTLTFAFEASSFEKAQVWLEIWDHLHGGP